MSRKLLNILLIDDDQDTQRIFKTVVSFRQHTVSVAKDGYEALSLLKEIQPDILVIDLMLPGLDGYQILDRVRNEGLAPNARFVATTAYHSVGTHEALIARGFTGFLPKPLSASTLVDSLEKVALQDK